MGLGEFRVAFYYILPDALVARVCPSHATPVACHYPELHPSVDLPLPALIDSPLVLAT